MRLDSRPPAIAQPARSRPLDRGDDRPARVRRPRRIPVQRPRPQAGRPAAGAAGAGAGPDRAQRALAALAFLRHPASLDHPRASGKPVATQATKGGRMILYRTIDSPIGLLTLAGRDGVLTNLRMVDQTYEPNRADWTLDNNAFADAVKQLGDYFAGERLDFDVELDLGGTQFQQRVWQALLTIPYGETRSYGEIAGQIGAPGAARAVGLA